MFYSEGWLSTAHCFNRILSKCWEDAPDLPEESYDQAREEFWRFCWSIDNAGVLLPNGQTVHADRFFLRSINRDGSNHDFFDYHTGLITLGEPRRGLAPRFWQAINRAAEREQSEHFGPLPFGRGYWSLLFTEILLASGVFFFLTATLAVVVSVVSSDTGVPGLVLMFFSLLCLVVGAYVLLRLVPPASRHQLFRRQTGGFTGGSVMFREAQLESFLNASVEEHSNTQSVAAVARRIADECRRGYFPTKAEASSRFAPDMSYRAFLESWNRAREEFPQLSRPGNWKSNQ